MKDILLEDFQAVADSDIPFEELRGSSFLITGATGLIGSLLVKNLLYCSSALGLDLKICALVRSEQKALGIFGADAPISYVTADLSKPDFAFEGECDYIIHAASVTASKQMVEDPVGTIATAVEGTKRLLALAVEKRAKSFVYISSMEVYGQPDSGKKTAESDLGYVDIGSVRSCYPEGKRMCECLCTAYAAQYGLNVKSARLAQTFGAGILPTESRVFAQFARSALRGENIVLHTAGESEGNYVYTSDAVRAILLLLVRGESGQAYNIANEESHVTIRQMAELVAEHFGEGRTKVVIDIPEDSERLGYAPPVKMWLDASKMRALGWTPAYGLVDSYRRMMQYMTTTG